MTAISVQPVQPLTFRLSRSGIQANRSTDQLPVPCTPHIRTWIWQQNKQARTAENSSLFRARRFSMKQEDLSLLEQGKKSLISSDPNSEDISGLLNPHDLMAGTLCPAGYILFCCSIISIHLQDLTDANVLISSLVIAIVKRQKRPAQFSLAS